MLFKKRAARFSKRQHLISNASLKIKKNYTHKNQLGKIKKGLCGVINSNNNLPFIPVSFGNSKITQSALIDTGSSYSFLSYNLFHELTKSNEVDFNVFNKNLICSAANSSDMTIKKACIMKIRLQHMTWKFEFLLSSDLPVKIILGANFIKMSDMIIDLPNNRYFFCFNPSTTFPLIRDANNNANKRNFSVSNVIQKIIPGDVSHLSDFELKRVNKIIADFPDVLTSRVGSTDLVQYDIKLTSNKIVRCQPFPLTPFKTQVMRSKIQKLLDDGVIENSDSQYSSPCFLVPKTENPTEEKDFRLVVDYRRLNQNIELISAPIGNLNTSFHHFSKAKYFSTLDLNNAYGQIALTERSKKLTAFITPFALYQYKRIPNGISSGAQVLSSLMEKIFGDLRFKNVYFYLDDLIVYTETLESHLEVLREVFNRLRSAGLTVNPTKVSFCVPKISFLGHIVSHNSISIDPDRTKAIVNSPVPKRVKDIQRFIGLLNFYHKFIPDLATIAAPLNALRKKDVKFIWSTECQQAFDKLKMIITQPPVLKIADFNRRFVLETDASSVGIGCVLSQDYDGTLAPIAFASRTLSTLERKYSAYEKEALAVLFGIEKFRYFLEHTKFTLHTDNSALQWVLKNPKPLGRIGRWILRISSFQFDVKHIKGTDNVIADYLSRMFDENPDKESTDNVSPNEFESLDSPALCNVALSDFPLCFTEISDYQKKDPFIIEIMNKKESGEDIFPYSISKGVLLYNSRNNQEPKIVLPSILKPMIFKYYHETTYGGHSGFLKTLNKIKQKFIWKGISKDLVAFIKSCKLCSLSKPAQKTNYGYLCSSIASQPMEKMFLDFVGPLPRTTSGNTMIFSCMDAFTKYSWLLPLRKATSESLCKELQKIFVNFGVPKYVVSDNGPQFKSNFFKNFCFQKGILHITQTEYNPKPNQVERIHRNLKSCLISFNHDKQNKWDLTLQWLPLAFNSAFHESSKFSPHELMFRHKVNNPINNIWKIDDILPTKFVKDTNKIWKDAYHNLLKSHNSSKKRYDMYRNPIPYKIGDIVFLKSNPVSKACNQITAKLLPRYSGPYLIKEWISPVSVKLFSTDGQTFVRRAHVSQLKMGNNP